MWSLGSLLIARGPGTPHKEIVLEWFVSKHIDFVMRQQTALLPISSASGGTFLVGLHVGAWQTGWPSPAPIPTNAAWTG